MYNKFNNKANLLASEFIVWPMLILVMVITIFYSNVAFGDTKQMFEEAIPEISYHFPSAYVHSFIMLELSNSDKKKFFGDENGDYRVKDLLWINSDSSLKTIASYRDLYISEIESFDDETKLVSNFEKFSDSKVVLDRTLMVREFEGNVPELKTYVENKNYYYSIPTKDATTAVVFFKLTNTQDDIPIKSGTLTNVN